MGRPVKRDVNGVLVFGDYTTTSVGIRAEAYFGGSLRDDVFVLKQHGAKRYKVQDNSDSTTAFCKLVTGTPAANGEMRIFGWTDPGKTAVALRKIQKNTATDFSGNKYTWYLQNDSSADYIVLTQVTIAR